MFVCENSMREFTPVAALACLGRCDRDGESALRIADYARRCNGKEKRKIIRRGAPRELCGLIDAWKWSETHLALSYNSPREVNIYLYLSLFAYLLLSSLFSRSSRSTRPSTRSQSSRTPPRPSKRSRPHPILEILSTLLIFPVF